MDKAWRDWLSESLKVGCSLTDLLSTLKNSGFDDAVIIDALRMIQQDSGIVIASPIDYQALSNIRITRDARARKIPTEHLQIYMLDGFMTPDECARMIRLIERNMVDSAVGDTQTYSTTRTSKTCLLGVMDDSLIENIDQRIAETIGIHALFSDIIEGQHYSVGQEFKNHYDYFTRGLGMHDKFMKNLGNRTWTFMVYLNDDCEGGGTHFPKIEQTFSPKTGTAVIWNNLLPNGDTNPYSMHAGTPVVKGEKVVITKWFRECARTPMLLD